MKRTDSFLSSVCAIAIPAALQSMLQSSFGIVDQIMIGQMGTIPVAAVGLAGKFTMLFNVVVAGIGAVAGIMISQYLGQKNQGTVRRSFYVNLGLGSILAAVFTAICLLLPQPIMRLYIDDAQTVAQAGRYLQIICLTFFPIVGSTMLAALLRCMEKAVYPLYASIAAAVCNTGLNYLLIFGKLGFPALGAEGAAIATVAAQVVNVLLMLAFFWKYRDSLRGTSQGQPFPWGQYGAMLLPLLVCEGMWSLGENVYAAIYGHLGAQSSAAMTLINPVQGMMTGALCGIAQAAGVLIGKQLGSEEYDTAYRNSKRLMAYGFACSAAISVLIVVFSPVYVTIYRVEPEVRQLTCQILLAYAIVAPFKVQNMILGGGILRSGGKTGYVMYIDLIGTWVFGVPLGLLAAYGLKLPVYWVYFLLSLEECVRYGISLAVFRGKGWMRRI